MEFNNTIHQNLQVTIAEINDFIRWCEKELMQIYPEESHENRVVTFDELESLILKMIY